MFGFVISIVVVICLVGGVFYGLSYLRAKATGKRVSDQLVESIDSLTKKP